jgi:hypothetical protein
MIPALLDADISTVAQELLFAHLIGHLPTWPLAHFPQVHREPSLVSLVQNNEQRNVCAEILHLSI